MPLSPDLLPTLDYEIPLWQAGFKLVAGIDEAGRGAWAGGVFAAAVILPAERSILKSLDGVRDSKLLNPSQRANWEEEIKQQTAAWAVGQADQEEIDLLGILPATRLAMQRAVEALGCLPQHLLLDAVLLRQVDLPQTAIIKGDRHSLSIACASILAKTARDREMCRCDQDFPLYGFARHKGYGTPQHQRALKQNGACRLHRQSFAPIQACAEMSAQGIKP